MLSKIENGITSPSLTTLQALSHALGVPVTAFFRRFEEERSAVFVKAGEGLEIERRGTRAGHQYNLLGHVGANTAASWSSPISSRCRPIPTCSRPSSTRAWSSCTCWRARWFTATARNLFRMLPGDSLFFDADAPHGPEELTEAADPLSVDHLLSAEAARAEASAALQSGPNPGDVALPSSYFDSHSTTVGR